MGLRSRRRHYRRPRPRSRGIAGCRPAFLESSPGKTATRSTAIPAGRARTAAPDTAGRKGQCRGSRGIEERPGRDACCRSRRENAYGQLTSPASLHARASRFTPSAHNTAACFDSARNPPTARSTTSALNPPSSARVFPASHSVNAEPAAIDAVHPRTLKRASATTPFSTRAESRRISPHAGFDASTVIAGDASSPTLRGFWK